MSEPVSFQNFDDPKIYEEIQFELLDPKARNFVVEFGPDQAQIAYNVDSDSFEQLVGNGKPAREPERPVRWINIWGPNLQTSLIQVLADRYKISRRFHAILRSSPDAVKERAMPVPVQDMRVKARMRAPGDIELGNRMADRLRPVEENPADANHYEIASNLKNYQSLDLGEKFLCIGANWMYGIKGEEEDKRLWTWLFLCDDGTVISLHEDLKPADEKYIPELRRHTIHVLKQLSLESSKKSGSISLVSVRNILKDLDPQHDHGSEGSSNLFYYLFDNWYSTYTLLTVTKEKLETLSKEILSGLIKKHRHDQDKMVIPGLYKVGKQLRVSQHLYESYENIIIRILRYRAVANSSEATPGTRSPGKRVTVALTASERFERLGDRIKLIVLSTISEAIAEKDALVSTYFNITAQKDSAATAKLSRNATLLSKLGVLFLPVSLMTSYFSVQIQDLQGVYTSQTYWICFGVIMALSFIALFFLSRFLVSITENLEAGAKRTSQWFKGHIVGTMKSTDDGDDDDA